MKHKLKKYSDRVIACSRLGCMASIEGWMKDRVAKDYKHIFANSDCPSVFMKDSTNPTHEERVSHLLDRAKKEIKDWNKLIKYWKHLG